MAVRRLLAVACLVLLVDRAPGEDEQDRVSGLVAQLGAADRATRAKAIKALGKIGPAAAPALVAALKHGDHVTPRTAEARVRRYAAYTLGEIRPAAKGTIPALVTALKDEDTLVRIEAAWALHRLDRRTELAVSVLIAALWDNDACRSAASYLGKIGRAAVPALSAALKDKEKRYGAARALAEIGPGAKEAIPALSAAFREEKGLLTRFWIATALAEIGPLAVPALTAALKDEDGGPIAAGALGDMGRPVVPALIAVLKGHKNEWARRNAARALCFIGPAAGEAVPALSAAFRNDRPSVQLMAARALAQVGPESVPALVAALGDGDELVRREAARALGEIGPAAARAIPALEAAARDGVREAGAAVKKIRGGR